MYIYIYNHNIIMVKPAWFDPLTSHKTMAQWPNGPTPPAQLHGFFGVLLLHGSLQRCCHEDFGDDFPNPNHDSRVREKSETVIIYPDI